MAGTNTETNTIEMDADAEFDDLMGGHLDYLGASDDAPVKAGVDDSVEETKPAPDVEEVVDSKEDVAEDDGMKPLVTEDEEEEIPIVEGEATKSPTPQVASRDQELTDAGVDPAFVPWAKQMSNQAFSSYVATLKEAKTLRETNTQLQEQLTSTALPTNYYEHPEAYTLDKRYAESVETFKNANASIQHWQAQFNAIRSGENWHEPMVQADGTLRFVEREPSSESETQVLGMLQQAQGHRQSALNEVAQLKQSFTQSRTKVISEMKTFEDSMFPSYKGQEDKNLYIKQSLQTLREKGMENNPLAGFISKLYAYAMEGQQTIKQLKAGVKPATNGVVKVNPKLAQPTGDDFSAGADSSLKASDTIAAADKEFEELFDA